jgi:hypothetical protein
MSEEQAPEKIWAQDADPNECDYSGGGWWDDECGNTQYPHMVEYILKTHHDSVVAAKDAEIAKLKTAVELAFQSLEWLQSSAGGSPEAWRQMHSYRNKFYEARAALGGEAE